MNWLSRIFGPWGMAFGEILFPAPVADGTIPKGKTPQYRPAQVAVSFKVSDRKPPMNASYIFAGVAAVILLIGV